MTQLINTITYRTTKMKPVDLKSSTCIDINKENDKEFPKFKVGSHVRISKNKNTSGMFHIVLKKFLWLKNSKTLCRGHILLVILMKKNFLECFTEKYCKNKSTRV